MRGREYPEHPMIGVGVVVFNHSNEILLVQRANEPSKDLWALPGGLVELGEELTTAAAREVMEECNIEVEVGNVVSVVDLIFKDAEDKVKYHYVLIDYSANYVSGNIMPQSDVQDAKWYNEDEIDELDIPEISRQVIVKAFLKNKNNGKH